MLEERIIILPFDKPAAKHSSEIFTSHFSKYKNKYKNGRAILHADMKIFASLLAFGGVTEFVTADDAFHELAEKYSHYFASKNLRMMQMPKTHPDFCF